jgi:hypothetical protein
MKATRKSEILRTIPLLIATCHCERSAAIKTRVFVATAVFLLTLITFPAQAKYGGGSGTAEDPYQIATVADLLLLGDSPEDYDKHFILTADIDLDPNLPGSAWAKPGSAAATPGGKVFDKAVIAPDTDLVKSYFQGTPFTGVFDGNGHAISNLTVNGGGYLGLFGYLESGAEVKDLGVVDVNIAGSGVYVGGLAGLNNGGVTQCYSTGAVKGGGSVGGLVGSNVVTGHMTQCYSAGALSGDNWVGGLVGYNSGDITQSYSSGVVTGTDGVGGLVGGNKGNLTQCYSTDMISGNSSVGGVVGFNVTGHVTQCYSTGAVRGTVSHVGGLVGQYSSGSVTSCFWDIQTSGQAMSAGGTGKTTAEMQMASTFLGWGCTPGSFSSWGGFADK